MDAAKFRAWINSDRVFVDRGRNPAFSDFRADNDRGRLGAVLGHIEDLTGGERKLFLRYVFGVDSAADLSVTQRNALWAWLSPRKFGAADPIPAEYEPPDLDAADAKASWWLVRRSCRAAAQAVVHAARVEAGQLEFPVSAP